jgi:hypothetical protein
MSGSSRVARRATLASLKAAKQLNTSITSALSGAASGSEDDGEETLAAVAARSALRNRQQQPASRGAAAAEQEDEGDESDAQDEEEEAPPSKRRKIASTSDSSKGMLPKGPVYGNKSRADRSMSGAGYYEDADSGGDDYNYGDDDDYDEEDEEEEEDAAFTHAAVDAEFERLEEQQEADDGLGLAAALKDLGVGAHTGGRHKFDFYCRFLLAAIVDPEELADVLYNPKRKRCPDAQLWSRVHRSIEGTVTNARESLAKSTAWLAKRSDSYAADVFKVLPFVDETIEPDRHEDCHACGRKDHPVSSRLDFFGPMVDSDGLVETDRSWIESVPRGHHRPHKFSLRVGNRCSDRIKCFLALQHWKYHLLLSLSKVLRTYISGGDSEDGSRRRQLDEEDEEEDDEDEEEDENISGRARAKHDDVFLAADLEPEDKRRHQKRLARTMTHLLQYSRGRAADDCEEEDWEREGDEGLQDGKHRGAKKMTQEVREMRVRAATWAVQANRRIFLRSNARVLLFMTYRAEQELTDAYKTGKQDRSAARSKANSVLPNRRDRQHAHELTAAWTDELLELSPADALNLGLPARRTTGVSGLQPSDQLRETSAAAHVREALPWEMCMVMFGGKIWGSFVSREYQRWKRLNVYTEVQFATNSTREQRASLHDLSGDDGLSALRPPRELCNATMINFSNSCKWEEELECEALSVASSDEEESEEGDDDDEEVGRSGSAAASSASASRGVSPKQPLRSAVTPISSARGVRARRNEEDDDDDDNGLISLSALKQQSSAEKAASSSSSQPSVQRIYDDDDEGVISIAAVKQLSSAQKAAASVSSQPSVQRVIDDEDEDDGLISLAAVARQSSASK